MSTPATAYCPHCDTEQPIMTLYQAFFVECDEEATPTGSWRDYESNTDTDGCIYCSVCCLVINEEDDT